LSHNGSRWIACEPGFFLPVRVLSRLFRRLFLDGLVALHAAGRLAFFGDLGPLVDKAAFDAALAPLRRSEWVVYAKRPFVGPKAVLAYLSRYTHRVAISNSRLIRLDDKAVTFKWKDYRARGKAPGSAWIKPMTLDPAEFIRRFLLHVLPSGFHRIRHYGFLASPGREATIDRLRRLIAAAAVPAAADACASSRPSPVALSPEASRPNSPESTPHDHRPDPHAHRPSFADDAKSPPPRSRSMRPISHRFTRTIRHPTSIRRSRTPPPLSYNAKTRPRRRCPPPDPSQNPHS
jgi:hypothetical protein